ncbi:FmdB family zinc ribbon protein [Chromobacterium subtsugae]|uniref:FmdB family zinc ribbon protein n=1 Tax=Chromobacterium subtsugae TaxID=251747 RepID=UPI000AEF4E3B|nr:hypothetical protein [Chromobacterium subtsugae]
MPIYVMKCQHCQHTLDIYRRVAEMNDNLPECCGLVMERQITAPFIQPDQPAYQAMAIDSKTGTAPMIEGRAQHREFLRRNDYVELGPESSKPKPRTEVLGDFNVRRELTEATREVLAKHNA